MRRLSGFFCRPASTRFLWKGVPPVGISAFLGGPNPDGSLPQRHFSWGDVLSEEMKQFLKAHQLTWELNGGAPYARFHALIQLHDVVKHNPVVLEEMSAFNALHEITLFKEFDAVLQTVIDDLKDGECNGDPTQIDQAISDLYLAYVSGDKLEVLLPRAKSLLSSEEVTMKSYPKA